MKNLKELKDDLEQADGNIDQLAVRCKEREVVVSVSCNDSVKLITALVAEMHRTEELAFIINMATIAFHEGSQPDKDTFKTETLN